jgi:hypothetical protein
MGGRELQRVGLSGYVVALRDRLDALDLGDNLRGCLLIFNWLSLQIFELASVCGGSDAASVARDRADP